MKSGFLQESAARICLGFKVILESPEKGALMTKDAGSQPCHCSLVGREGGRGAAEALVLCMQPKPGISCGTESVFVSRGGARSPFATGRPCTDGGH